MQDGDDEDVQDVQNGELRDESSVELLVTGKRV